MLESVVDPQKQRWLKQNANRDSSVFRRILYAQVTNVGYQAVWQRSKFGLKMPIKLLDSSPITQTNIDIQSASST